MSEHVQTWHSMHMKWKVERKETLLFPPYLTFIPLSWSHFSRYSCTRRLVMISHTDCLWSDHISAQCLHGAEVLGHCGGLWCQQSPTPIVMYWYNQQAAWGVCSRGYAVFGRSTVKAVGRSGSQDDFLLKLKVCVVSKDDLLPPASRVTFRHGKNISTVRSMKCWSR